MINWFREKLEREVALFLLLTLLLSAPFYYLIATVENKGWLYFGLMWCPGVAGLLISLLLQANLKGFGWGPGKPWYLLASYLYPLLELSLVYGIIWALSLGGFAGFETNVITSLAPWPMLLMIMEGTYFSGRSALGEEIGWRGYLTPRLLEKYSPNSVSLLVGGIWALWHYPLILSGDYGVDTPVFFQLLCFTLMLVGTNFIYTWFRIKSGSMWTGVLLHTVGNLFIIHVFDELTTDTGNTAYFMGETGAVYALYGALMITAFLVFGWDWPGRLGRRLGRRGAKGNDVGGSV